MTHAPHSVTELTPRSVWQHFAALSAVPRPSKREERVRAHVRSVCEGLGLAVAEDDAGNLVASVPASAGRESAPTIVLQAHLDMVCEKNAGTEHDFDQDPIRLILDQDADGQAIVRADGTTLGADNGIGVALMLAAASESISRGPLELLFTVDEEEGMGGAIGLDPALIHGKTLLNLDTEEDDMLYIGCAGGCDSTLRWQLPTAPVTGGVTCSITLRGLRGGHSGGDIHEGRGSATQLLARVLGRVGNGVRLVSIDGGSKRNALAREAHAVIVVDESTAAVLTKIAAEIVEEGRVESREPDLTLTVDRATDATTAATVDGSLSLIDCLLALPHGVAGMHPDIPTLVETSNNLATIASTSDGDGMAVTVGCLSRSSSESRLDEILARIAAIARLAGATVENGNRYPGWEPNVDSPVLAVAKRVHEQLFDVVPAAEAVHAGLECGLLGRKLPGTDMVSLGPRIEGAHSPDERVWVASVERSWTYLVGLLDTLST
ncbi:MAG: beta-Ala-His dipeptidase [Acidobacteriota bacterium]